MNIFEILMIAVGLAMDAFAVSIADGTSKKNSIPDFTTYLIT